MAIINRITILIVCLAIVLGGCSESKLSQEEYLNQAEEMLKAGNLEDAIYSYQNLVKFYPESEKIGDYRAKLLELTLDAVDKFSGTRKGENYFAEALTLAETQSDSTNYWIKFKLARKLEETDTLKANKIFSEIPIKGYDMAAQVALGEDDIESAIAAYEKWISQYPENENNYKALFLMGFSYSEYLKEYDKARQIFIKVIEEYPNCDLVPSAEWMLENMGKPDSAIQFMENPRDSELTVQTEVQK